MFWRIFTFLFCLPLLVFSQENSSKSSKKKKDLNYFGRLVSNYAGNYAIPQDQWIDPNFSRKQRVDNVILEQIQYETTPDKVQVVFIFSNHVRTQEIVNEENNSFTLDFVQSHVISPLPSLDILEARQFIQATHLIYFIDEQHSPQPHIDLITLHTKSPFEYEIKKERHEIIITFKPQRQAPKPKGQELLESLVGKDNVSQETPEEVSEEVSDETARQEKPPTKEEEMIAQQKDLEEAQSDNADKISDSTSLDLDLDEDGFQQHFTQFDDATSPHDSSHSSENTLQYIQDDMTPIEQQAFDNISHITRKIDFSDTTSQVDSPKKTDSVPNIDSTVKRDDSSPPLVSIPKPNSSQQKPSYLTPDTPPLPLSQSDNAISISKKTLSLYSPKNAVSLRTLSLEECIQTALNHHIPAQVAIEKVKLAQIRYFEARRNLFPQVNLELTHTEGKVDETEPFLEREYKLSVDQNIYDGGEKSLVLHQSKVNLEVAKKGFDKIRNDLSFDVSEAYYTLVMAHMNLMIQRRLLYEVSQIVDQEKIKFDQNLVREVDFRSLLSSYNQIQVQVTTAHKDLKIARITLAQYLTCAPDDIEVPSHLGFKDIPVLLQESIDIALQHNPDYVVNQLMTEYHQLDREIQQSKGSFKVDLATRYGWYGADYVEDTNNLVSDSESDSVELKSNWYAGIRVSKVLGGSTLEANVVKEDASPRLGQTERGNNFSRSLKFSLLDKIKGFSDSKQSDVSLQEALLEASKTKKDLIKDIHSAYCDYQKALIQIEAAYSKISFREQEYSSQLYNALYGDGAMLPVVDSKIKLADEKSYYFQALANYYVAIATLNKIMGCVSYYH